MKTATAKAAVRFPGTIAAIFLVLGLSGTVLADPGVSSLFGQVSHRYQAVLKGTSFYCYTQVDRIGAIEELFRGIEYEYALLELKKNVIQLDFTGLRQASVAAEKALPDAATADECAASNLRFLDRARLIVASFKDSHFSLYPLRDLSPVRLPFGLAEAEGKVVIVSKLDQLIKYMTYLSPVTSEKDFNEITLGDEVVAIDGKPVSEAIDHLMPYISASSVASQRMWAVDALTVRAFALPESRVAKIQLKKSNGSLVTLYIPWVYQSPSRGDEAAYLDARGFTRYDQLKLKWDPEGKKWKYQELIETNGDWINSMPNLFDEASYFSGPGMVKDPVLKTGYLLAEGRATAVLQINSYGSNLVFSGSNVANTFVKTVATFVAEAKAVGVPLILDLRSNPGGFLALPPQVLSVLAKTGSNYSGVSQGFRMTPYALETQDSFYTDQLSPESGTGISQSEFEDLFVRAGASQQVHTDAFSDDRIVIHPDVGGYDFPIVALVSPMCISACDVTVSLLKSTKRAVIIGQSSNGTGAGYWRSSSFPGHWSDSRHILRARIPNFLFGRSVEQDPANATSILGDRVAELNLENRPTEPDLSYAATVKDLIGDNSGWFEVAIAVLGVQMTPDPIPSAVPSTVPPVSP